MHTCTHGCSPCKTRLAHICGIILQEESWAAVALRVLGLFSCSVCIQFSASSCLCNHKVEELLYLWCLLSLLRNAHNCVGKFYYCHYLIVTVHQCPRVTFRTRSPFVKCYMIKSTVRPADRSLGPTRCFRRSLWPLCRVQLYCESPEKIITWGAPWDPAQMEQLQLTESSRDQPKLWHTWHPLCLPPPCCLSGCLTGAC